MTIEQIVLEEALSDTGDTIAHACCCRDEDTALCGIDVSMEQWEEGYVDESDNPCVVCLDLDSADRTICPRDWKSCP